MWIINELAGASVGPVIVLGDWGHGTLARMPFRVHTHIGIWLLDHTNILICEKFRLPRKSV